MTAPGSSTTVYGEQAKYLIKEMEDPIQYVAKVGHELTELIHDYGGYLLKVFAFGCFAAIASLLFRKRKSLPQKPASARTRAIVRSMLALQGCLQMQMGAALV